MVKTIVCSICSKEKKRAGNNYRNPIGKGSSCGACTLKWKRLNDPNYALKIKKPKTEAQKQAARKWDQENKSKRAEYRKKYRTQDPERYRNTFKKWYDSVSKTPEYLQKKAEYFRNKTNNDPHYRLASEIRKLTSSMVKYKYKSGRVTILIGAAWPMFKFYFESKFTPEMNWENYGTVWQVDHIKPLAEFNLFDKTEYLAASHYSNIQPLSIKDHLAKTKIELDSANSGRFNGSSSSSVD